MNGCKLPENNCSPTLITFMEKVMEISGLGDRTFFHDGTALYSFMIPQYLIVCDVAECVLLYTSDCQVKAQMCTHAHLYEQAMLQTMNKLLPGCAVVDFCYVQRSWHRAVFHSCWGTWL